MRRASAITIRSGLTTSRTLVLVGVGQQLADPVEAVVEASRGAEHVVAGDGQVRDARQDRADHLVDAAGSRETGGPCTRRGRRAGRGAGSSRPSARSRRPRRPTRRTRRSALMSLEGEQLVEAGDDRQLLGLDAPDARPVEDLDQVAPGSRPRTPPCAPARRAAGRRGRRRPPSGRLPSGTVERVGQRVRRIGAEDERARARHRRSAVAVAAAVVVLPTPPLPVKRRTLTQRRSPPGPSGRAGRRA